jgi:thioredoxin-related protein
MNRYVFLLFFSGLSLTAQADQTQEWLTDVPTALQKAKQENKILLLDFTGSDWCGWCVKLKNEVLDQPEFKEFAKTNLVLVEVDFPHHKQLEPAQQEANKQLAQTYRVGGFPTIVLLNRESQALGKIEGYLPGGPRPFLEKITQFLNIELKNPPSADSTESPRKPVAFELPPPAVPIHYQSLALKGISGSKKRRMALINNQTLMVGETASVKVQDERVEVCCKEIREDSVLITANGKPLELKLGGH